MARLRVVGVLMRFMGLMGWGFERILGRGGWCFNEVYGSHGVGL
jgi:hypothetical protein